MQQRLLSARTNALDLVEWVLAHFHRAPRAVGPNGEAVCLIPQSLQIVEQRRFRLEHKGRLVLDEEALQPGVAIRPLGHPGHGDVVEAQVGHDLAHGGKLACPPVDQDQIRAGRGLTGLFILGETGKAPVQHLFHHAKIVAGCEVRALDIELAVLAFLEALRPCHDHTANRIGSLDMAVVIDLDPFGNALQAKGLGNQGQQFGLGRTLSHLSA